MKYFVPASCVQWVWLFVKLRLLIQLQSSSFWTQQHPQTKRYKKLLPSKSFGTIKWNNKNPFKPNNNKWHRNYRISDSASVLLCSAVLCRSVPMETPSKSWSSENICVRSKEGFKENWHFNYIKRYFRREATFIVFRLVIRKCEEDDSTNNAFFISQQTGFYPLWNGEEGERENH